MSAPLDVIKTRIQNRNFENPESGFRILANMAKNEGPTAFFKGLVPKVGFSPMDMGLFGEGMLMRGMTAPHDWSQAGLLLLARPDVDPCLRHGVR